MASRRIWAAFLVVLPLSFVPLACGGDDDQRAALLEDELQRELNLALERDTQSTDLQDDAAVPAPDEAQPSPPTRTPEQAEPTPPVQRTPPAQPTPPVERTPPTRPAPRDEAPAREPRQVMMTVPTGTTFAIRLEDTLGTDRNRSGDPFEATLTDPIVSVDGTVLIPTGATVRGRVTAAEVSNRVGETAVIKLAFESVSFEGRSYPLRASVVEANPERRSRRSTGEQAARIAAGTAAGALLGQILGKDTESTLKGAAIGAAAGTAIAMGTADVDAVLPSGSRMVIRLDAPVEVRTTVR